MSIASHDTDLTRIADAVAGRRSGLERLGDFVALMKPRVMSLVVFTALVGLLAAPGRHDPVVSLVALLCISAGAGAAGALNMWYDADIDAVMSRTAMRPIPRGRISRPEALAFGLMLAAGSVLTMSFAVNVAAAALLAFTIFFYVVVYTLWLKRRTSQNIVIGGAAGAFPPVIGWAATTGGVGIEPLVLFLIIFLWTPPHFWALSLNRAHDYARSRRSDAAGRRREGRNKAADLPLQLAAGACFDSALGARTCRTRLRNDIGPLLSNDDHVGIEAPQKRRGGQAAGSSPVHFLHCLLVRAVRRAADGFDDDTGLSHTWRRQWSRLRCRAQGLGSRSRNAWRAKRPLSRLAGAGRISPVWTLGSNGENGSLRRSPNAAEQSDTPLKSIPVSLQWYDTERAASPFLKQA